MNCLTLLQDGMLSICQAENAHTRILMIIIIVNHLLPATHDKRLGSARYNAAAQLCALVYMKNNPDRTDFGEWAKSQMEYLWEEILWVIRT